MGTIADIQNLLPSGIKLQKVRAEEDGGVTIFISSDRRNLGKLPEAKAALRGAEPGAKILVSLRGK